ncbi:hypothetical protein A3850_011995 [Lewinella sp. 4G2]|nr:hypothetical protein A3850_011995 [Lewinella sp. 4G2]
MLFEQHNPEYYAKQAADWEAIATGECSDANAIWNYYKAAHYANRFAEGTYDLPDILAMAEERLEANSFELNYLRFADAKDPTLRHAHLVRANAADPNRLEAATALSAYYTIIGQWARRDQTLIDMHRRRAIPEGVMEYNYNQLMSVGQNGVLLTYGDADTYPSWLLQSAYRVRPDVHVINYNLLVNFPAYREVVVDRLGIKLPKGREPDTDPFALLARQANDVYVATTARETLPADRAKDFYLTGLTLRISEKPLDNLDRIAQLYRHTWRLEQLRFPFAEGPRQRVADQLNQNYLPALLTLYEAEPKLADLKDLISGIADRAGVSETVNKIIAPEAALPALAGADVDLRAKDIAKGFSYVPSGNYTDVRDKSTTSINGFYAGETNVTNAEYQSFLEDLLRQRDFDLLSRVEVARPNLDTLKKALLETADAESYVNMIMGVDPRYAAHPVVNISYEAAELYAIWLAQVYNSDPKRPDGRNVRFRLFEATEYAYAAQGGREYAPYPWGGPYYRNSKGCILGNLNMLHPVSLEETKIFREKISVSTYLSPRKRAEILERTNVECEYDDDGGFLTVQADAYYPNDYGLYNMAGNAATMVHPEGTAAGGSYLDPAERIKVGSTQQLALPHPGVGFRLIMMYVD